MESTSSKGRGRRSASKINPDLLQTLKDYPYASDPFNNIDPNKYSEAGLKEVVNVMREKIQEYILKNPKEIGHVIELLKPKLGDDITNFVEGNYHKELLDTKTLKRCFESQKASKTTIKILEAFQLVVLKQQETERQLERITGQYVIYATHNTRKGKFQTSIIWIKRDGTAIHRYKDRNEKIATKTMSAEIIQHSNLLLTLKEKNLALIFFAFIGDIVQPPFIQAIFLYSNMVGNTIGNLTILHRVSKREDTQEQLENRFHSFIPKRYQDNLQPDQGDALSKEVSGQPGLTIWQNIQQYLLYKARPMSTKVFDRLVPFNFGSSVAVHPGPYFQRAKFYETIKRLSGTHFIYFNERFQSALSKEGLFEKSDFFSSVGRGILEIGPNPRTGVLECTMKTKKNANNDWLIHKGHIMNLELSTPEYVILNMYLQPAQERFISILLKVIDENRMIGGHAINYTSFGNLGAGSVVTLRKSLVLGKDNEEDTKGKKQSHPEDSISEAVKESKPESFLPYNYQEISEREQKIINYLSRNRLGLVTPPNYKELNTYGNTIYEGLYKMYTARIKGGAIKVGLLRIYGNGHVTYKDPQGDLFFGEMEIVNETMNITMRDAQNLRTGFCCIGIEGVEPKEGETFYSGTFAGIARDRDRKPVASQFYLQFIGKDKFFDERVEKDKPLDPEIIPHLVEPETINFGSPEMENIPEKIQEYFQAPETKAILTFKNKVFREKDIEVQLISQ